MTETPIDEEHVKVPAGKPRKTSATRPSPTLPLPQEVAGLFMVALGGVCLLALVSATRGVLSDLAADLLRQGFGWGAYVIALSLLGIGILLLWRNLDKSFRLAWRRIVGLEALVVFALGLTHLIAAPGEAGLDVAGAGGGGGYLGWLISYYPAQAIGRLLTFMLLIAAELACIALILQLSIQDIADLGEQAGDQIAVYIKGWRRALERAVAKPAPRARRPARPRVERPKPSATPPQRSPAREAVAAPREAPRFEIEADDAKPYRPRRRKSLPSLELLASDQEQPQDQARIERQARIIEETLYSFGVPATVVDCRHGPTVTQFGLEPGYLERRDSSGDLQQMKIRVNKITALSNDLALALAAAPIRIEAPVPGRGVVGIEVPNGVPSTVSLRGVVESREFAKLKSPLRVALGRDVAGHPLVADLAKMPHLLIAGATNSGKSICINALVACLLLHNTPEDLRLILVDPKRVEMVQFGNIPHLLGSVLVDVEEVISAIRWLTREMERRYHLFSSAGARNLQAYNRRAATLGEPTLPNIVVFIDELAELMLSSPDEVERHICRIAQMARATGIHLAIATQRPSVDVVTGLIKANFPARICFATTSQVDSRVVLDAPGGEKLLGRGDMLFMPPDSSKLIRAQGCLVSDAEIEGIAAFWRDKVTAYPSLLAEPTPWAGELGGDGGDDALVQAALALIQDQQQISTSFLQRRLRIGYPRAARLMEQLEEMGYIGPAVSGGRSRQVLDGSQDDA